MVEKQVLKNCELFATLGENELERIASLALEEEYEAGAFIFREGDSASTLFVLEEGKVALQMTLLREHGQIGRSISIDVVTRNEAFGWSAIVEPYIYTLTAVCLQRVKALSIKGSNLRRLLDDNPKIGYEVLKGLIKMVATRLEDTRRVLVSERLS